MLTVTSCFNKHVLIVMNGINMNHGGKYCQIPASWWVSDKKNSNIDMCHNINSTLLSLYTTQVSDLLRISIKWIILVNIFNFLFSIKNFVFAKLGKKSISEHCSINMTRTAPYIMLKVQRWAFLNCYEVFLEITNIFKNDFSTLLPLFYIIRQHSWHLAL